MSSEEEEVCETCETCETEHTEVHVCNQCTYDYCEECAYEGGCGVCYKEECAWAEFDEAVETIRVMSPPEQSAVESLQKMVAFMEYWSDGVQSMDSVLCMSFYDEPGFHDSSEIMTDCGDAVLNEKEWFLEKAQEICEGKYVFDTEVPLEED